MAFKKIFFLNAYGMDTLLGDCAKLCRLPLRSIESWGAHLEVVLNCRVRDPFC